MDSGIELSVPLFFFALLALAAGIGLTEYSFEKGRQASVVFLGAGVAVSLLSFAAYVLGIAFWTWIGSMAT